MKILSLVLLSFSHFTKAADQEFTIINPTYPGTHLRYAHVAWNCAGKGTCASSFDFSPPKSDFWGANQFLNEDGVCRSLGYERALKNSSGSEVGSNQERRIQVDDSGKITGAAAAQELEVITCINQVKTHTPEKIVFINSPRDPVSGLPFSKAVFATNTKWECAAFIGFDSDEDSVCRLLGYSRAVAGSSLDQSCGFEKSLRVTPSGTEVVNMNPMHWLICFE